MCCAEFPRLLGRLPAALLLATLLAVACAAAGRAGAQILSGPWVQEMDAAIDRVRKTDLRVIVLDAGGDPVPRASVRIEQLGHAIPIGFTLPAEGWPVLATHEPVWRCFNAVSMAQLSDWAALQPEAGGPWETAALDHALDQAATLGWAVRWGGLISADPARNPAWLMRLGDAEAADELSFHVAAAVRQYAGRVGQFDVYTHLLDHDHLESRFGEAMLRRVFERAKAAGPKAQIAVRFEDALTGPRTSEMVERINALRQGFVPFDVVAMEQRIGGAIVHTPIARALDWTERLGVDVVLTGLEVGGPSPAAAAINLETLLRTAFAYPHVKGIWLAGLAADQTADPHAALFDAEGELTPVGQTFDALLYGAWQTRLDATADELGNVRARVFAGTYEITAAIPAGAGGPAQTAATTVWLPVSPNERIVVVQQLAPAEGMPDQDATEPSAASRAAP